MDIPMLSYIPTSQNQRVKGYTIPGEEQPRIYSSANLLSGQAMDELIQAAYRQLFNEQQMLANYRQPYLESQLRNGQITVREFMRGLLLSDNFRRLIYDCNSNYRVVQLCIQRLLGRDVYGDREKLAWSIVLATQGLQGFADVLLGSEEYLEHFGDDTVPYQRRRILPQQAIGQLPFARMARYGAEYRDAIVANVDVVLQPKRVGVLGWGKSTPIPANPLVYIGGGLIAFGLIYITVLGI
ncbi:MAG: phycobilisome rod-core linker polypeptide CpcG [Merismopedia sp. SIO2A8]|nr:phycobilisome rod-core linker polypeptide CpcG [Merismopedia sp. SIO2A8]